MKHQNKNIAMWLLGIPLGVLIAFLIGIPFWIPMPNSGITKETYNLTNSCYLEVYAETDNIGLKVRLLNLTVSGLKSECAHLEEACRKRDESGLLDNYTQLECRWMEITGNDNRTYSVCSCRF